MSDLLFEIEEDDEMPELDFGKYKKEGDSEKKVSLAELLREREEQEKADNKYLKLDEETWHKLLSAYPQIIEEGLILIKHEERISNNNRIDLHYKDKNDKDLIVEVKRVARNYDLFQLLRYGLDYPNARLMFVAEVIKEDLMEAIAIIENYTKIKLNIEIKELIPL